MALALGSWPAISSGTTKAAEGEEVELARLSKALEMVMGWPVDIECAYRGRDLYLLQCRPITTLGAL